MCITWMLYVWVDNLVEVALLHRRFYNTAVVILNFAYVSTITLLQHGPQTSASVINQLIVEAVYVNCDWIKKKRKWNGTKSDYIDGMVWTSQ